MGDNSNAFHREIVRPHTEELLAIKRGDLVLDIACGNGNFSQRLAENGAQVVGFDYSERLIEHAKRRRAAYLDAISFHVCDATQYDASNSLQCTTVLCACFIRLERFSSLILNHQSYLTKDCHHIQLLLYSQIHFSQRNAEISHSVMNNVILLF